jgi:glycosyltransferase involved in cell wall biosynthesis
MTSGGERIRVVLIAEASPVDPAAIGGVSGLLRALMAHAPTGWELLAPRPSNAGAQGSSADLGPSLYARRLPHRILFPVRLLTRIRTLMRLRPDLVYTHSNEGAMLLCLLRRLGLVRFAIVHHQHGSENPLKFATFRIGRTPGLPRLYAAFLGMTHRSVDHLVVIDGACLRDNLARGVRPDRMTLLMNAIDTEAFRCSAEEAGRFRAAYGIPGGSPLLSFVGRLEEVKRIDVLIEALPLSGGEPWLVVAGDGTQSESLRALAARSAAAARIVFTGSLEAKALRGLYAASDALVLPSAAEGVPLVILEAMSCGIPVVATAVGGVPELLCESNGILVESGCTASRLAGALSEAVGRAWDREAIRGMAGAYAAPRAVEVLRGIFEAVIERRRRRTTPAPP